MSIKAKYVQGKPLMVDYTPVAAVAAGAVVVINSVLGFVHQDIAAATLGALAIPGAVYDILKDASVFADRDPVYWSAGSQVCTSTSGGNTFLGLADGAALTGAASARVITMPITSATTLIASPLSSAIADPGNGLAIPVTQSGYCPIVTAGSETRTLAIPGFIGQELLLYIKTDGGTAVITVASAINQTGNNTITMADVRDVIRLVAIESGSNKVWHVVSNDGAALSTV